MRNVRKIYPSNDLIKKNRERFPKVDLCNPFAQKIFNYIIFLATRDSKNTVILSTAEFFSWLNINNPSGYQYHQFSKNLEKLRTTFIHHNNLLEDNKIDKGKWPLISAYHKITSIKNKTLYYKITLNIELINFYKWKQHNVQVYIDDTRYLDVKYAYKLYELLLYLKPINKRYPHFSCSIDEVRRILSVPEQESNARFVGYLKKALENVNDKTGLRYKLSIKKKNKTTYKNASLIFEDYYLKYSDLHYQTALGLNDLGEITEKVTNNGQK